MARDTLLGFPRTPFLTVAENLLLYRQSQGSPNRDCPFILVF